jgi:uncharacterized protein (TIGR02145 family)
MRTEKTINTFIDGIDQDTSVNKVDNKHYFDAQNLRIITNDPLTNGALSSVIGNTKALSFNINDIIIGVCKIKNAYDSNAGDSTLFFCYNSSGNHSIYLLEGDAAKIDISTPINMDALYRTVGSYRAGYLYRGSDLNFLSTYKIQAEARYESSDIRKVYWVDGVNPIRYMNIDNAITLALSSTPIDSAILFDITPEAELVSPSTSIIKGGNYKAGLVQHAYQLYVRHGARTTFSPLSNVLSLSSSLFSTNSISVIGNKLDDNTGISVQVDINNLDENFNRIRIVAIHYTQPFVSPTINIIGEFEYSTDSISIVDNGLTTYGTIPIEEFRLQGQINYVAGTLGSKNNIMFYGNLKEDIWNPDFLNPTDSSFWDARAIRFRSYTESLSGTDNVYKNIIATSPSIPAHGITFTINNVNSISISITNFSTWAGISSSRTMTALSGGGVFFNTINNKYIYGGSIYNTTVDALVTAASYNAGADTLTFDVRGLYSNLFAGIPSIWASTELYRVPSYLATFRYNYTATADPVVDSRPYDTGLGETVILPPSSDIIANWNAAGWANYAANHDGINRYNDIDNDGDASYEYKYKRDGVTIGAEGPNLEIDFTYEDIKIDNLSSDYNAQISSPYDNTILGTTNRDSARNEVYRIYIVFFNKKMQHSNPQWVCDLRMPTIDDDSDFITSYNDGSTSVYGRYLYPKISIKNLPSDSELLGWQIFRCERGSTDRSILAKGLISPLYMDTIDSNKAKPYSSSSSMLIGHADSAVNQYKTLLEMISPEVSFNRNLTFIEGDRLRIDGRYDGVINGTVHGMYFKGLEETEKDSSDSSYLDVDTISIEDSQTSNNLEIRDTIINLITYKNIISFLDGSTRHIGQKGTTLIVKTDQNLVIDSGTTGWISGSYIRNVFNTQYGGNTYEARSYNSVIPYSDFVLSTAAQEIDCIFGDMFISYFAYLRSMFPTQESTFDHYRKELVLIPVESSINCSLRLDPIQKYTSAGQLVASTTDMTVQEKQSDGITNWPESYPDELIDLYSYNSVYSVSLNAKLIQCKLFDSSTIEENPVKIIATDKKINNEYFDNWTNIKINNYIEVDGQYGELIRLVNFNNRFFAFQNKGISLVSINERSLIQDNNRLQLTLGTGEVLDRYDYITTSSGIYKLNDLITSFTSIYYLDRENKTIYSLTSEGDVPISEIKGIRSLLKSYDTINHVAIGFDPEYKEIIFCIYKDSNLNNTVIYNEYTGSFVAKYSFIPLLIYNVNGKLFSVPYNTVIDNEVYLHNVGNYNVFYGEADDSFIEVIVNPNGNIINKYDVLDIRTNVLDENGDEIPNSTIDELEISNDYQSTNKVITFSNSSVITTSLLEIGKKLIRKWRMWLLPDNPSSEFYRFVDTYVKLKLIKKYVGSSFEPVYGYLYNWYAATDVRNIAADGWHLPTHSEYVTLRNAIGGEPAGGKMKEIGLTYWDIPNTGADNSSMFNGRGSGDRSGNGSYAHIKQEWHCAVTYDNGDNTRFVRLNYLSDSFYDAVYYATKRHGHSIRLLKDTTILTHGETGIYVGNDGRVYRTICIGTQEWLADNLAETKYRNGDSIPEVTDNDAWAALLTGARCSYNNDEDNALIETVDNTDNKFILHDLITYYRPVKN